MKRVPLSRLERQIQQAREGPELQALLVPLKQDPRQGAQRIVERTERRLLAAARERERLAGLFELRRQLIAAGARWVAGVDEVGVGPLAGPVVACAVVLPEEMDLPGLNDSKKLSPGARQELSRRIRAQAVDVSVAEVTPHDIDRLNIYHAALEAMRRAVVGLTQPPDHVLVDAHTIPGLEVRQTAIVGGDSKDGSIAAASIVAKVYRDALMVELDARFPVYGFARHKGYPTPDHQEALRVHGPSPEHRRSFAPVARAAVGRSAPA